MTLSTHNFILTMFAAKDPRTVKHFDEAGARLPGAGLRNYGFSPVGEPCVDIQRYMARPNVTINFLTEVDGMKYNNLLNGATNTIEFLQIFEEASNATDVNTGRPALEVDDTIVVDNLPAHQKEL